jgi:hypothetical protein
MGCSLKKMKTIVLRINSFLLFFLIACGPRQSEIEATKRAKMDSTRVTDSIHAVMEENNRLRYEDSLAVLEQASRDAIARGKATADSIENAKRGL